MPINPNIPLQAQPQINPLPGINMLSNAIQTRKQNDAEKETRDLTNQKLRLAISDAENNQKLNLAARDTVSIRGFLAAGDIEGAKLAAQNRLEGINRRNGDATHTKRFIQALEQDPQQAAALIEQEINGLSQLGFINRDQNGDPFAQATKMFKNGTVTQASGTGEIRVTAPDGTVASTPEEREKILSDAYRAENSKLKSDEEVNQLLDIEKAKHQMGFDDEKRQLEIQSLQKQLQTSEFKIAEGKEQQEKAAQTKKDTARLVQSLLNNASGVRNFVGPADQYTPTLLKETLQARTDINQLKSILTAQNLGIMAGVLSETDVKIIAQIAGGGLDVGGSDDAFLDELTRISNSLAEPVSDSNIDSEIEALEAEIRELEGG